QSNAVSRQTKRSRRRGRRGAVSRGHSRPLHRGEGPANERQLEPLFRLVTQSNLSLSRLLWQLSHAVILPPMAQQTSFDIVSEVDAAEITNALNQTLKEVRQRFDFKGSKANVVLEKNELVLTAEDETKLRNMNDILQQKLVRRGVPLKAFSYGKIEPAAGGTVRQRAQIQEGIPQEKAKEVVKFIKDSKVKVQAAIQGDIVRV